QAVRLAFSFALAKAGNNNPARIAMMAMTTRSSIRVKASSNLALPDDRLCWLEPVIATVLLSFFGSTRSKSPLQRKSKDAVGRDSAWARDTFLRTHRRALIHTPFVAVQHGGDIAL